MNHPAPRIGTIRYVLVAVVAVAALALTAGARASHGTTRHHRAIVTGHAIAMPARGTHRTHLRRMYTRAIGAPIVPGIPGVSDIAACNPVPPAAETDCNLTYHNGSIMRTATTHLVYWAPSGYSFPSGYTALIEQYLTDVAHDSGDPTFTDSVATQYYDTVGGGTNYFQNSTTFAGALTDTNAYPSAVSGCNNSNGSTACLTETQEFTELDSFINSVGGARGTGDLWFLIVPPKVQTCFDDFSWCGPYGAGTSGNEYCAYHNSFTGGFSGSTPTVWSNMPYVAADGCPDARPNNNDADPEIDVLSHEMNEAMTNPTGGGWFDENTNNGGENGDQCNFVYGTSIGSTSTGTYDELINGHPYSVQQEWSNAITGCAMNYGAVAPTASFTFTPASPVALQNVAFDGSGSHSNNSGASIVSYAWDFGDGTTGSGATPAHAYAHAGTYTVSLTVEDSAQQTASTTHAVVVATRPTTLTYTGPAVGDYNDAVTLSATLTDNGSSAGVSGETVSFTLGAESCSGTTDSGGNVSCSVTPLDVPGPYVVAASFGGDNVYSASSTIGAFTLQQDESRLTYTGAVTSHYHDSVTVAAQLTDPDGGAAIAGRGVTFALGSDACSATTDAAGNASCSITPSGIAAGTITASFGGDTFSLPSATSSSFSITPEETTMTYTGPTTILAGSGGATLTATLLEDGSGDTDGDGGAVAPSPAEPVTLSLGSQSCTGTTNAAGHVTCTIPSVSVPLGPETVGASFAGDGYYSPSSATTTAIVFAFPSRGAFTLGDQTVAAATPATTVTWWADTWSALDSLTGGAAPAADKGFAGNVTLPTTSPASPAACTPNWTTTGGNSPPPTSGVPSYMGVLVTSRVTKNGSTIAGNTVHIVVVAVGAGYSPNPANHGVGTVVATYC